MNILDLVVGKPIKTSHISKGKKKTPSESSGIPKSFEKNRCIDHLLVHRYQKVTSNYAECPKRKSANFSAFGRGLGIVFHAA